MCVSVCVSVCMSVFVSVVLSVQSLFVNYPADFNETFRK